MVVEQTGSFTLPVETGIGHQFAAAAEDVQERLDLPFTVDESGDRFAILQHINHLAGAKRVGVLNDSPVALGQGRSNNERQPDDEVGQ
jgi:hypothetical protein